MKIKFGSQEAEKRFNITIMPDSILETDEAFILKLSSEGDARVDFGHVTDKRISISDDDGWFLVQPLFQYLFKVYVTLVVEIGFSQPQFSVIEGDGVAILTVEIIKGKAERAFLFHVRTFQQQAEAGW